CPACNQPVKSIYYPIAVPKMLDRWIEDSPMEQMLAQFPGGADIPVCHPSGGADIPVCHPSGGADIPVCHPSGGADIPVRHPPGGADIPVCHPSGGADIPVRHPHFACLKCHGIHCSNSTEPARAWNQYISHISAGLLYGHEVKTPADLVARRHHTKVRQLNRHAPLRRKVLTRLANGWSPKQIAENLSLTPKKVRAHIHLLCRDENVPNVAALAKKLNFAKLPPPNVFQLARARR